MYKRVDKLKEILKKDNLMSRMEGKEKNEDNFLSHRKEKRRRESLEKKKFE